MNSVIRVAAASIKTRIADCNSNADSIITAITEAAANGASLAVLPELSITGYTCGDLFLQSALIKAAEEALSKIIHACAKLDIAAVVGLPVRHSGRLYNCAAVFCGGKLLGLVPKMNLPEYGEFSEGRFFYPGSRTEFEFSFAGFQTSMSPAVVFEDSTSSELIFGVEICEDLWASDSPANFLCRHGNALVICNPCAYTVRVTKDDYVRELVRMSSSKNICAYVLAACGMGESTTDVVFNGSSVIADNYEITAVAQPFKTSIIYSDVDLSGLTVARVRNRRVTSDSDKSCKKVSFTLPKKDIIPAPVSRLPFVPSDKAELDIQAETILDICANALSSRLEHIGLSRVILGLSGGLDSTLALLICRRAFDIMGLDPKGIFAVSMPCFGTTHRTRSNAQVLAEAVGAGFEQIDITKTVLSHFDDISHPHEVYDTAYENAQARERTQVLMDKSNSLNALVVGTGDLSELALGWATYGGDHISMYSVNAGIPKTLIRRIVAHVAECAERELSAVLNDILNTPVSPELLPPDGDSISQQTEDIVGPYELHDFFLWYLYKGYSPDRIFSLAVSAFDGEYTPDTVKKWLKVFIKRFFSQQFKRSCMPDGPMVCSVTLSPRSGLHMPSDACADLWLEIVEKF